mmetsp:Transcript_6800/g.10350  ORF Transcript_6800/g.10350 Transcript_6800/m.10350 type:complete len:90 (-) Transcript_6800:88-357(-)
MSRRRCLISVRAAGYVRAVVHANTRGPGHLPQRGYRRPLSERERGAERRGTCTPIAIPPSVSARSDRTWKKIPVLRGGVRLDADRPAYM